MKSNLEKLYNVLESKDLSKYESFAIPSAWLEMSNHSGNNIDLFRHAVKNVLDQPRSDLPLLQPEEYVMAQVFLQHFTAYEHGCEEDLSDDGTLLKTIITLPLLQRAGFNSIMLMPHFLRSETNRKGDRGSPYSVRDYYRVDPELVDGLTSPELTPEEMFGAFVEAAHHYGLRVIIDMVPRTAARDSLWILENPEWFYWIKPENRDQLISLLQTYIPGIHSPSGVNEDIIDAVLKGLPLAEIMKVFEWAPSVTHPEKWKTFCAEHREDPDLLDSIRKEFGLITPPCTSDCVNDPQPPWTDVTPLRLFEDYPPKIAAAMRETGVLNAEDTPPFFIQPILKASNFPGLVPMKDLWDRIGSVTRHYHDKYGVDGVRGDMFHALPSGLIADITDGLPETFLLIMENLNNYDGENLSLEHGFQIYTGNFFTMICEGPDKLKYFIDETSRYKTAMLAMPVLHDTRPLFSRSNKEALFQLAVAAFVPHGAWAFSADTLIPNRLPVNFGLGFSAEDQEAFTAKLDAAGRKLAMFYHDTMTDEWNNYDGEILNFVQKTVELRHQYITSDIAETEFDQCILLQNKIVVISYTRNTESDFLVIGNASSEQVEIRLNDLISGLSEKGRDGIKTIEIIGFIQEEGVLKMNPWGLGLLEIC